jgi:hypothetical protein
MTACVPASEEKQRRKKTRELVATAYLRELTTALTALAARVDAWRAGQIDVFQLNEEEHAYYSGPARALWKKYNMPADALLPLLVAGGVFHKDEVPAALLAAPPPAE